ncbi:hypothetical protein KCU81_g4787, partial [Aureobasidium melanogenum]|uniref:Uncharacterized protein n=1 Tax=Aureobasidium melanogenum (strain CBS 110374) TaxID=1043003 RepID=A0A074VP49_AURM1
MPNTSSSSSVSTSSPPIMKEEPISASPSVSYPTPAIVKEAEDTATTTTSTLDDNDMINTAGPSTIRNKPGRPKGSRSKREMFLEKKLLL